MGHSPYSYSSSIAENPSWAVCSQNWHWFFKSSRAPYLNLSTSEQRLIKGHGRPDRFFIRKFNVGKPAETEHGQTERPDLISLLHATNMQRMYATAITKKNKWYMTYQLLYQCKNTQQTSFEVTLCTRSINLAMDMVAQPQPLNTVGWTAETQILIKENFAENSLKQTSLQ